MAPWCWPHEAIAGFFSSFDQRLVALSPCRGRGLVHGRIGGRMHKNLWVTALNCPWGFVVVPGVAIVSAATDADSAAQNQRNEWPASLQRRHMGSAWGLDDPTDIQWNCEQSPVKRESGAAHVAIEEVSALPGQNRESCKDDVHPVAFLLADRCSHAVSRWPPPGSEIS